MNSQRSRTSSDPSPRVRTVLLGVILALTVVILAAVGVVAINPRVGSPGQPVITGTVTGTVAIVNADGTALCLTVGGSQDNLCYGIWRLRGQPLPAVSETVTGWVVRVPKDSNDIEELILKPEGSFAPGAGVGS